VSLIPMAQRDVYDWLKNKRGFSDEYFSIRQVQDGLRELGLSSGVVKGVWEDLISLELADFVEIKMSDLHSWKRLFRLRKKYA
jgi:hypothetical protein